MARWYDPSSTGQFVSQDPMVGDSLQSYTYAGDSPVTSDDPTGDLCAMAVSSDIVGGEPCPSGGGGYWGPGMGDEFGGGGTGLGINLTPLVRAFRTAIDGLVRGTADQALQGTGTAGDGMTLELGSLVQQPPPRLTDPLPRLPARHKASAGVAVVGPPDPVRR